MLKRFVQIFGGDPIKKTIDRYTTLVDQINGLEAEYEKLSDDALYNKTSDFRKFIAEARRGLENDELDDAERQALDELMPQAFAAVREASKRTIGLRHYDVQLIGGAVLHQGNIAEMRTGEGKTLVATLPLYLNALTERGVHLITVNDYLARRDARWMSPIYNALGMTVGVLQMAARTENGKKAFLVDLEKQSPHEDQHQLRMAPRGDAYRADITYGTNSEFGFDYLRDNMAYRWEDRVQRGHYYAIVDEVDNVLIDEARTPLIISGPAQDDSESYYKMAAVVRQLRPEDYEVSEKDRNVSLTEMGEVHVEELLGVPLRDPDRPEDLTLEQERTFGYLEQALRAQHLFRRNKEYLVQNRQVIIVDEFTGRMMPGRRWSDGLHQAVEAKEGVRVQPENVTHATITIQNYFRMYKKLAGMSGTALTEAEEFDKIYKLEVKSIPTNLDYLAARQESDLVEVEGQDEKGYKYRYYTIKSDSQRHPVFWKRKDYPDIVYRTVEIKLRALAREILQNYSRSRPVLVGTTSVELSDRVSGRLKAEPIRRLAQVLLLRHTWMISNKREEDGRQIPELQYLNAPLEELDTNAMRKMGRELGLPFNPEDPSNIQLLLQLLELTQAESAKLSGALQGGIQHQVLNARKHTEESQIIAGAGAFGAVTIATNMAGRGVDIKLGGELSENILASVNRILRRAGYDDPYDLSLEEHRQALLAMSSDQYGLYEDDIRAFLDYMEAMERVRQLGGLHVIGSERHEARRIDNQLRGRSARQGDPGSSRFYLSMEDELMRLFGGQQADNMMQRMKIDDAMPLEVGLVSRIVEQSQTRVEGQNFDMRKHLLEYDDVLNTQRMKIYSMRDRIFHKDDLSEDVAELLREEIEKRVPAAFDDEEGPWKLLSWLEQIQPSLRLSETRYPSFTLRLVLDEITDGKPAVEAAQAHKGLLRIADESIKAEREHSIRVIKEQLEKLEDWVDKHFKERKEEIDLFFEGLETADETDTRSPRQLVEELGQAARLPLRLPSEQVRSLRDNPKPVRDLVEQQVEQGITLLGISQLVVQISRRLGEELGIKPNDLVNADFDEIYDQVLRSVHELFEKRRERNLAQIRDVLHTRFRRLEERGKPVGSEDAQLLTHSDLVEMIQEMSEQRRYLQGRLNRKQVVSGIRFYPVYFAAHLLRKHGQERVNEQVLQHLEEARLTLQQEWGGADWKAMANRSPAILDEITQRSVVNALGEERARQTWQTPMNQLDKSEITLVCEEFGRKSLTGIYRQLLLSVITSLWVEYLTSMEALRVSISLESYAQRDPLVQYKSRASELFQQLMNNIRTGVVSNMFTYMPRDLSKIQSSVSRVKSTADESLVGGETLPEPESSPASAENEETAEPAEDESADEDFEGDEEAASPSKAPEIPGNGKKKRRRRRR